MDNNHIPEQGHDPIAKPSGPSLKEHAVLLVKKKVRPERTADLLLEVVEGDADGHVTIGELMQGLGDRAFGLVMLLVALPNCVPSPPGIGSLLGLPILLFSIQMIFGQHKPWLPKFIANRGFARADLLRIIQRAEPYIRKFEKICRPRLEFMTAGATLRVIGFLIFLLSFLIVLPFPGTNWLPAVAIAVISIGLIERDGLIVLISVATGLAAFYASGVMAYEGTTWILHKAGFLL